MDLIGTHAQLRVSHRHIQQIANDVARSRGPATIMDDETTATTLRRITVTQLRRSLGITMVRMGTWLSGLPAPTMTTTTIAEQP